MDRLGRIDQLKNMLEKEPNDLFLNFALGLEYASVSETLPLAELQFNFVIEHDHNYIAAYYQLGKLRELQGQNEKAIEIYKSGLEKAKAQKNNKAINEFSEAIFMLED